MKVKKISLGQCALTCTASSSLRSSRLLGPGTCVFMEGPAGSWACWGVAVAWAVLRHRAPSEINRIIVSMFGKQEGWESVAIS